MKLFPSAYAVRTLRVSDSERALNSANKVPSVCPIKAVAEVFEAASATLVTDAPNVGM
jgi:hypothetical protein